MKDETLRVRVDTETRSAIDACVEEGGYETISQWMRHIIAKEIKQTSRHGSEMAARDLLDGMLSD